MRIAVCIKQVPLVWAMKFDPASKTLKREGVPAEISAFDLRALAKAVELARLHGGEVVVLTMGPPQARKALEECLAIGADRAVHLCDAAFAGSDTLATSRALAAAIRREQADLILCGRYSVDAETGQVGPEIAELLDLPQISGARTLEVDVASGRVTAEREIDDGVQMVEATLPVVITAAEDLAPELAPSKEDRERAKEKPVAVLTAADLGLDASQLGLAGSPTWVSGFETVEGKRLGQVLAAESLEQAVAQLVDVLLEKGLFGEWKAEAVEASAGASAPVARAGEKDVWVVAEALGGHLRPVTLELLGKGAELARRLGGSLSAVLLGDGVSAHAGELAACGADRVLVADEARLGAGDCEMQTAVLADAIRQRRPGIVLVPGTSAGRDLAPRLAARLGLGLTGDCLDLELDAEGRLLQLKPAFGGSIVAPVLSKTRPEMATVRPGVLDPPQPDRSRTAPTERLLLPATAVGRVRVIAHRRTAETATALDNAEVVVGVGKGIGSPQSLAVVTPLLDALGAALCATRDVTDEGWLPKQYQVGFTGRMIAPRLYIAIGIRGAVYHMMGVRRAGVIVAINNEKKAPIFKAADYGLVGDYAEVVPLLAARLRQARPARG